MNDTIVKKRPFAQLCALCHDVFDWVDKLWSTPGPFPMEDNWYGVDSCHHCNLAALKLSATRGCGLCEQFIIGLIKQGITYGDEDRLQRILTDGATVDGTYFKRRDTIPEKWKLRLYVVSDDEKDYWCSDLELHLSSQQALMYDSTETSSVSTQDALPFTKQWLHNCLQSHETCNAHNSLYVPTRLLHLDGEKVRLSLALEREQGAEYATLSHCWGSLHFEKLKKHNLNAFRTQIPPDALTKTFKDAIHTAKYLGLKYIWIDSLCIIQDDEEDWRKEASLMSSVYGGSAINIAASDALDGRFGCFQKRDSSWRCQIQIQHVTESVIYDCIPKSASRYFQKSPLATRGWVFQELVLAKRKLHFTKNEVFWECEESTVCETFLEKLPSMVDSDSRRLYGPLKITAWQNIIDGYSRCKLTYSRDKLIAISGLARIVQEESKDEYVAGMWRKDLEFQLIWAVSKEMPQLPPHAGPSWSWTSSGSIILLCDRHLLSWRRYRRLSTVHDVNIKYVSSSNPWGELESASLRLCCEHLVPAIVQNQHRSPSMELGDKTVYILPSFDCLEIWKVESAMVYILPIIRNADSEYPQFFGIMVEPTGKNKGQYRRVGYFSLDAEADIKSLIDYSTSIDDSPCVEVLIDENGVKRYVVDLV